MFGAPNNNYSYDLWYKPQPQQNNVSVVFIQGGEYAANNYLVAPNQSVILIDNDQGKMFIKATDASGMPIQMRKFNEEKQIPVQNQQADFITRDEFEKRLAEITNAKQSVQSEQHE